MPPSSEHPVHACRDCGLVQRLPPLEDGMVARCERCRGTLRWARCDALPRALACALSAALLFVLAVVLPFMKASVAGRVARATLWTGPEMLRDEGRAGLAIVVCATLLVLPAAKIAALLTALLGARAARPPRWLPRLLVMLERIGPWAMIEVFVLGTFVAYTRISALADVTVGPGGLALAGAMLALVAADASLDHEALWEKLEAAGACAARPESASGAGAWLLCDGCGLTTRGRDGDACPRCGQHLHRRKLQSVGRTWAYLAAGAVLYVPANALPVMTFTKLGRGGAVTILGGIRELFAAGLWPLGALVFVASFVVPLLKLLGLGVTLVMTQWGSGRRLLARTRLVRLTRVIGRWSMIDIFALTTLVALVHMGLFAQVLPGAGAAAFCGVVVMTMVATDLFDPRLMWDAAGHDAEAAS